MDTPEPKHNASAGEDGLQVLAGVIIDLSARVADKLPGPAPHAARLGIWCSRDGLPESTLRAAIARGVGPRTYTLGRLFYITREDWEAWHSRMAETGGFALSNLRRDHGDAP